jgi:hypothetical protein
MYFAVADKTVRHPSVDWVQVAVFTASALVLPQARFAFTELKPPKLKDIFRWHRRIFGWYGKAFGWGFTLGQKMVRSHPKSRAVHPVPEEAERNSLYSTGPASSTASSPPPASTSHPSETPSIEDR